jgi:hypothetical protein
MQCFRGEVDIHLDAGRNADQVWMEVQKVELLESYMARFGTDAEDDWGSAVREPPSFWHVGCRWSAGEFYRTRFVGECLPDFESYLSGQKRELSEGFGTSGHTCFSWNNTMMNVVVHEIGDSGRHAEIRWREIRECSREVRIGNLKRGQFQSSENIG